MQVMRWAALQVKKGTELGKEIQGIMKEGKLVPTGTAQSEPPFHRQCKRALNKLYLSCVLHH